VVPVTTGRRIRRLDRAACHNGLETNLHQVGRVPQERLPALLGAADVKLLPYTRRPVNLGRSPNSAGHAMSAARPIVTNDTGDLGALVRTEGIGLAAEENGEAMAQAVQTLLDDPARAEAMGRRARHLAETTLAWPTLAAGLARFYASITAP
jgi:glycosyltransferase involved in cell wall biosynthesis